MATYIHEFFGYPAGSTTAEARLSIADRGCPFVSGGCDKHLSDNQPAGVCSLKPMTSAPVICCPNRLYAGNYEILKDIAGEVFGEGLHLLGGRLAATHAKDRSESVVAVFGKRWGGELPLPKAKGTGSYYVDWILAHVDESGELLDFVAVEVQTIDTTGNYRKGREALIGPEPEIVKNSAGFNWENVNKRILPQLIYKGKVLRREDKCSKGLYFVTPKPVYDRITDRLGGELTDYPAQPGSITFLQYDYSDTKGAVGTYPLKRVGSLTTTVDEVAQAFSGTQAMPPKDSYRSAIETALAAG